MWHSEDIRPIGDFVKIMGDLYFMHIQTFLWLLLVYKYYFGRLLLF
jgi:hypothetical protein